MFTLLEDTNKAGLCKQLNDLEEEYDVFSVEFTVGTNIERGTDYSQKATVYFALVRYTYKGIPKVKPQPVPARGW